MRWKKAYEKKQEGKKHHNLICYFPPKLPLVNLVVEQLFLKTLCYFAVYIQTRKQNERDRRRQVVITGPEMSTRG